MAFWNNKKTQSDDIYPDEIFLDSSNLPQFDMYQFEGRLEHPISKTPLVVVWIFFLSIMVLFSVRLANLEIFSGDSFRVIAENNRLNSIPIFAERGAIFDRNGIALAWNEPFPEEEFSARVYSDIKGLSNVLGYVSYPARDTYGFYYKEWFEGKDGVELAYDDILSGTNGLILRETNAKGEIQSQGTAVEVSNGKNIELSIDARLGEALFLKIENLANEIGFAGGAGVIIDIENGEILAMASFPEYDSGALTSGDDYKIKKFLANTKKPFLNRVISGLYTPGSIVKPVLAMAALQEQLISPEEKILSIGYISIPHPYIPEEESRFLDWKAHGLVDMREALAVSSNVYFYEIGGGLPATSAQAEGKERKGLGIGKIEVYMRLFGFGKETGIELLGEETGVIPTPKWKEKVFGDDWRLGDTYNTSIGQYGFQVTPIQAARAVAAIANNGKLLRPRIVKSVFEDGGVIGRKDRTPVKLENIPIDRSYYQVVREGMRLAVEEGTAKGLNIPNVSVAAKTGTAEIGTIKKFVHSWVTGFFPYENPRYAFAVVMERGPSDNLVGALFVFRELLMWMTENTPEYLE